MALSEQSAVCQRGCGGEGGGGCQIRHRHTHDVGGGGGGGSLGPLTGGVLILHVNFKKECGPVGNRKFRKIPLNFSAEMPAQNPASQFNWDFLRIGS